MTPERFVAWLHIAGLALLVLLWSFFALLALLERVRRKTDRTRLYGAPERKGHERMEANEVCLAATRNVEGWPDRVEEKVYEEWWPSGLWGWPTVALHLLSIGRFRPWVVVTIERNSKGGFEVHMGRWAVRRALDPLLERTIYGAVYQWRLRQVRARARGER